jgi:hypothetical protein
MDEVVDVITNRDQRRFDPAAADRHGDNLLATARVRRRAAARAGPKPTDRDAAELARSGG